MEKGGGGDEPADDARVDLAIRAAEDRDAAVALAHVLVVLGAVVRKVVRAAREAPPRAALVAADVDARAPGAAALSARLAAVTGAVGRAGPGGRDRKSVA